MHLTKTRLTISVPLIAILLGALYCYNIPPRTKQVLQANTKSSFSGSLQVDSSPASSVYSICISACNNTVTPQVENSSIPKSTPTLSQDTSVNQNSGQSSAPINYGSLYLSPSTPVPTFDYNRPSPTLSVPPSPSCGVSDSSYYANCMDSYCNSYPDTSICLSKP